MISCFGGVDEQTHTQTQRHSIALEDRWNVWGRVQQLAIQISFFYACKSWNVLLLSSKIDISSDIVMYIFWYPNHIYERKTGALGTNCMATEIRFLSLCVKNIRMAQSELNDLMQKQEFEKYWIFLLLTIDLTNIGYVWK